MPARKDREFYLAILMIIAKGGLGCEDHEFRRRILSSNFSYFCSLSDGSTLLLLFGCGFGYSPTFGDESPFKTHALLLRRELNLLL